MIENTNQPVTTPAQPLTEFSPAFQETGGFSHQQLQQMAQNLVDKGKKTLEEANAMLATDGVAPLQKPAPKLTPFDLPPAAAPVDFRIPPIARPGEPASPDHKKVDTLLRDSLSKAGFTKELGSSLAEDLVKAAHKYSSFSFDSQRETWTKNEKEMLTRAGVSKERIDRSAAEMARLCPEFMEWLQKTGASDSSNVVLQLVLQTERLGRVGK